MNKCLQCGKEIEVEFKDAKWCSMDCKGKFILDNFSLGQCIGVFEEEEIRRAPAKAKALAEWKESGLSFTEYLLSKGDFKEGEADLE